MLLSDPTLGVIGDEPLTFTKEEAGPSRMEH